MPCRAMGCGKIRQTRRAAISLHFNVLGRLQIEPLLAARPKPLKFREIAAEHIELMGPEPSVSRLCYIAPVSDLGRGR